MTTSTTTEITNSSCDTTSAATSSDGFSSSSSTRKMTETSTIIPTKFSHSATIYNLLTTIVHGLLQTKSSLSLQNISKLLMTLDGRDKMTKLLQYICRFLVYWDVPAAADYAKLKVSLTNSRKAYRLGRSLLELQKLRSSGLLEVFGNYLVTRCSTIHSNIYMPIVDAISDYDDGSASTTNSTDKSSETRKNMELPKTPMWQLLGVAGKTLGLCGFWAADNIFFLLQSGVTNLFDSGSGSSNDKIRTKNRMKQCSVVANRFYFTGSVFGLLTNWRIYYEYKQRQRQQKEPYGDTNDEQKPLSSKSIQINKEEVAYALQLLKSVVDVIVFSNNPGIDIWKNARGYKLHEGLHCICGILSASSVLCSKYPNE